MSTSVPTDTCLSVTVTLEFARQIGIVELVGVAKSGAAMLRMKSEATQTEARSPGGAKRSPGTNLPNNEYYLRAKISSA
jgi:hypothetical protein